MHHNFRLGDAFNLSFLSETTTETESEVSEVTTTIPEVETTEPEVSTTTIPEVITTMTSTSTEAITTKTSTTPLPELDENILEDDEEVLEVDEVEPEDQDEPVHTLKCLPDSQEVDGQVVMKCKEAPEAEPITVLISAKGLDLTTLARKNVKLVVKDYMLMEMQTRPVAVKPKRR